MTKSKMSWKVFYICALTVLLYPHINYGCPITCACTGTTTDCGFSGLTEVPSGIPINTEKLDLSFNPITSLPEGVFTSYVNITSIWFINNKITSLPEGLFSNNLALSEVNFELNNLKGLPEGLFANNPALSKVVFARNQIPSVPEGFFSNNPALKIIYLGDNPLLCCNMSDLIDWIQNLTEITLDRVTCTENQNIDTIELVSFNTSVCPQVDGQWSDWSEMSCSSTCGVGNITRTRECNNPEPSKYGQRCEGLATAVIECYQDNCPTDEEFDWVALTIGLVVGACFIIGIILVISLYIVKSKETKVSSAT